MNSHAVFPVALQLRRFNIIICLLAVLVPVFCMQVERKSFQVDRRGNEMLLSFAATHPGEQMHVIVQKTVTDGTVEALVARLGGTVTKDLSIINALAADLPSDAVSTLAQAPGVRWVSPDATMVSTSGPDGSLNVFPSGYAHKSINVLPVWAEGYQGSSATVAVVDSGINGTHPDLLGRVIASTETNANTDNVTDFVAHGTHVAGVIGGDGSARNKYYGIAPEAKLLNVKVSDDQGGARVADVVAGLQWVLENKARYNIRVVNLSLNSNVMESYHTDPLCAAVEILWFNGIVVIVAAGNSGAQGLLPPANDPFVITVGATEDTTSQGTIDPGMANDRVSSFSAYGTTTDGFPKPDLVAPGKNIVSALASPDAILPVRYVDNKVDNSGYYFKISGTSMAAPIVSGAVALLLQDEPNLTPDQVKYRLKATAVNLTTGWTNYNPVTAGAGYLDVYAALHGTTTASANTGLPISHLLTTGTDPMDGTNWNSANWNSANWTSANWTSANWTSANWNSTYWEEDAITLTATVAPATSTALPTATVAPATSTATALPTATVVPATSTATTLPTATTAAPSPTNTAPPSATNTSTVAIATPVNSPQPTSPSTPSLTITPTSVLAPSQARTHMLYLPLITR